MEPTPQNQDPINEVKITETESDSPSKLLRMLAMIALGWGVIGLLFLAVAGESFGLVLLAPYFFLGGVIILLFVVRALIYAVQAFQNKQSTKGFQYLALIIILPIIGVGLGCGTCLLGVNVIDGF